MDKSDPTHKVIYSLQGLADHGETYIIIILDGNSKIPQGSIGILPRGILAVGRGGVGFEGKGLLLTVMICTEKTLVQSKRSDRRFKNKIFSYSVPYRYAYY